MLRNTIFSLVLLLVLMPVGMIEKTDASQSDVQDVANSKSQVRLRLPFTKGEYWRPQTYGGHHKLGPQYAVDFWWASPQRADTYYADSQGKGRAIRAAHNGRVFIFAFDITSLGDITRLEERAVKIQYDPANDSVSPSIPTTTFVLGQDIEGSKRAIDLELVVKSDNVLTVYVHLKIADRFFTADVRNKMKDAVKKFYNNTALGRPQRVAIDTDIDVREYDDVLGYVDQYGLASGPHLHFQVHSNSSMTESAPFLGEPFPLDGSSLRVGNDDVVVLVGGEVLLDEQLKWPTNGPIYNYPAVPRNHFNVGDTVVVDNPNPLASTAVRETAGKRVVGEVPNGTMGEILNASPQGAQNSDDDKYYLWWNVKYPSVSGWTVSPYLSLLFVTLTEGLRILGSEPYFVGDKLRATFTVRHVGPSCDEIRALTVCGLDPDRQAVEFLPKPGVVLCEGDSRRYEGYFRPMKPGTYHFFVAYQNPDGRWVTNVPAGSGTNTINIEVRPRTPANFFSERPTIALSLGDPVKQEYRIGETIRLKMAMTAGQVAPGAGAAPRVSIFLWVDTPYGRRFLTESQGRLVKTVTPSPVCKPIPPIDYTWDLLSIPVTPSSVAGTYTWNAAMYLSDSMSEASLVARSPSVSYLIVLKRGSQPSVTSVRTSLNLYRVGDTMVIYYSTLRGTGTGNYDLMVRITSKASRMDYYFYDDSADTNRWIHKTPRPMWTGVPQDGNFQIPSGNMPPIVIEDSMPSGDYTMTMYFSEPGKNTPVGGSAQTEFRLETPTPEGGCFIATAAYGSPMASSVELLRSFRKRFLLPSGWGRGMVRIYERIGPRAAAAIRPHWALRKAARIVLWPVVAFAAVALRLNLWLAILAAVLVVTGFAFMMGRASNRVRLAILALALPAAAQAADVQGTVVRARPFPIPIPGARVELVETGQVIASDQDGGFRFLKLAGGEYTLKASSPGYLASSLKVSVPASTSVVKVVVPLNPVGERVYEYYLPHTAEGGGWWTFFNVVNPGNTSADLTMAAYDAEGNYLGASAKISRLKINQQLSGAPSNYFAPEVISKAAWYKLTSSVPLTGFEVFGSDQGTLAGFPFPTADSSQLYLPHVAQDDQWWTGVSFVSAGTRLSEFHLEARDRIGRLLVEAGWPKYLGPGEKTVDVINNYFGWDFPAEIEWASVRSDSPITGFELFGTRDFKMMAAVPALTQGAKKLYFPHVVTTDGWWTGIAMLNVDVRPGTLRMTAYGEDGKALADSRSISLVAGERTVGTAESFFDNWPGGVKYLEVASDVAVVGFELVGRSAPPLLGGLPALSAAGTRLAYSHAISTSEWETSLGILNTSGVSSQVTFQAFDANGNALAQVKVMLSPKGYGFWSLRSLFGRVSSGTAWVKASSDGAPLVGFFKLTRVSDGQFTDIPAEPIVAPEMIGSAAAATVLAERPELARLASQVEITPVPGRGFRVSWPAELNSAVRALVGDLVRSGDIIVEIGGIPLRTLSDLWDAYRRFRDAQDVGVVIWREDTGARAVRLRNPLAQSAR